jgi:hypothetical protein
MELYHGSNIIVQVPEIRIANRFLDFGYGFYTTTNKGQAIEFASNVSKRTPASTPFVSVYELDKDVVFPKLKVLNFDKPDGDWLDFVAANRSGVYQRQEYDIVFGPVADDDVYTTLTLYMSGEFTKEYALEKLKVKELYNQMVFMTDASLQHLRFTGALDLRKEQGRG